LRTVREWVQCETTHKSRQLPAQDCALFLDKRRPRTERNRRRFTEATDARTWARTFLANSRDDSVDAAWIAVRSANWTRIRMLRVCQVNRYADDHGNCPDTSEPSRQLLCGHSVDWRGAFPANCPDNARQLPGTNWTYSPEIAWMIRGTPTGLLRGLHRQLLGHS
jgi:hypothetical protein